MFYLFIIVHSSQYPLLLLFTEMFLFECIIWFFLFYSTFHFLFYRLLVSLFLKYSFKEVINFIRFFFNSLLFGSFFLSWFLRNIQDLPFCSPFMLKDSNYDNLISINENSMLKNYNNSPKSKRRSKKDKVIYLADRQI